MSKLLQSQAVGLPEIKNQKGRTVDETCWVHIRINKESKKNRISSLIIRKVATSRKSKAHNQ